MTTFNPSYFATPPATLRIIERESINLVLVGCGGTGSWLAPAVVRTARLLIEKFNKKINVVFFDPDLVEPKNCYRQNFAEFEVGQNKAVTLARRYGLAWGLEVMAVPEAFNAGSKISMRDNTYYSQTVIIGAVDGPAGRREINRFVRNQGYGSSVWWLDCGNDRHSGQVLLGGYNTTERGAQPFPIDGYCAWLPWPSDQHPDLLEDHPPEIVDEAGLSCADLALHGAQGLAVNQQIAAIAADYLLQLMVYGTLSHFQTYFEQTGGNMRSTPITPETVLGIDAKMQVIEYSEENDDDNGDEEGAFYGDGAAEELEVAYGLA